MRRRSLPGEPEPPSKGALKRQAQAVQDVADRLVEAPDGVLAALDLPEAVRDAVLAARRITSRAALLRQRQFVAKLLRKVDVEPIRLVLESAEVADRREARRFRQVERWRDRIVEEGEPALEALLQEQPLPDPAGLRALATAAWREQDPGRRQRARRELFRALNEALPPE